MREQRRQRASQRQRPGRPDFRGAAGDCEHPLAGRRERRAQAFVAIVEQLEERVEGKAGVVADLRRADQRDRVAGGRPQGGGEQTLALTAWLGGQPAGGAGAPAGARGRAALRRAPSRSNLARSLAVSGDRGVPGASAHQRSSSPSAGRAAGSRRRAARFPELHRGARTCSPRRRRRKRAAGERVSEQPFPRGRDVTEQHRAGVARRQRLAQHERRGVGLARHEVGAAVERGRETSLRSAAVGRVRGRQLPARERS